MMLASTACQVPASDALRGSSSSNFLATTRFRRRTARSPVEQFREDQPGLLLALRREHPEHQRQRFPAFRTDVAIHAFVDAAAGPPDADERVGFSPDPSGKP